ncbi:RNA-binding domain-containing protein [Sanghuangporus baumii]|uniref:RNA-binding domain-containing protein n=1 Tax=Sanghuangporus baumii TaxID=108892 RepID=A0A9Q5HYN9_SANBA|nr:RNA-binding domain-containing protein [Sanghuangporus baumii]
MSEDAVVLGKRKQRDADDQRPSGSTLFVSNLPYTATSTDLKTLFSDFAPVRSAFVVLEDNVSKGVGYVSFAITEDAKSTLDTIERDGLELNGRKLRPKEGSTEKKVNSDKASGIPQVPHPKTPKDPNAIRTLLISGLPGSIEKKALWKKIRKYEGAESVELLEGEPGLMLSSRVPVALLMPLTNCTRISTKAVPAKKEDSNSSAAPSRASRLIVRNLPWDITEKDLRALFLPFGPVYSINIPMNNPSAEDAKDDNRRPRAKGFAFVWFFSRKDAEKAIAGINGRAIEAGSIVAPTLNKKERQRLRRQLREKTKIDTGEDPENEDDNSSGDEDTIESSENAPKTSGAGSRILAVDWALSKDKWEEAKAKTLDEQPTESEETSENEAESSSDLRDEDDSESESGSDEALEDDEERSVAEEPIKPTLPQTDVGTTLFVRNLPFDATEDELRVLFRTFGPLRYARITVDAETGRSRGTGFACFWNKEDADKAIQQSELLSREAGISTPAVAPNKKNPFSLPSLLTPDPSSSLAQPLVLHGRTLDVARAVTRDEAVRLKDEGERQREKADKRNLYLLREGVIFPSSPAAASLSATEIEKRQASFNARRNVLKSNPLLYVSKARLSMRQIPLFVSDRILKRLGIHAMRAFEEEVKRGEREPLSAEEMRADDEIVHTEEGVESKKKRKGKKADRETGVKQAKIVRQANRVDPLTDKGRSRGYGFLEMKRHSDALRVLRWSNNNRSLYALLEEWWKDEVRDLIKILETGNAKPKSKADANGEGDEDIEARLRRLKGELERLKSSEGRAKGSKKTLIVEFSIENAQVVNRRKENIEASKSKPKRARSASIVSGDDDGEVDAESNGATPTKRRKIAKSSAAKSGLKSVTKIEASGGGPMESEKSIGSIIGRKRKMRKAKGKGKA